MRKSHLAAAMLGALATLCVAAGLPQDGTTTNQRQVFSFYVEGIVPSSTSGFVTYRLTEPLVREAVVTDIVYLPSVTSNAFRITANGQPLLHNLGGDTGTDNTKTIHLESGLRVPAGTVLAFEANSGGGTNVFRATVCGYVQ